MTKLGIDASNAESVLSALAESINEKDSRIIALSAEATAAVDLLNESTSAINDRLSALEANASKTATLSKSDLDKINADAKSAAIAAVSSAVAKTGSTLLTQETGSEAVEDNTVATFESVVSNLMTTGKSKPEAISETVEKHPELHAEWLASSNKTNAHFQIKAA